MNRNYRNCPIPLFDREINQSIGLMLLERSAPWLDQPVLAERQGNDYRPISWKKFLDDTAGLVDFFNRQGIRKGDRLAVFSPNSYAMLVWEMAAVFMGAVSVSIFAGYDTRHIDSILHNAEPDAIYVDSEKRFDRLLACTYTRRLRFIVTSFSSPYIKLADCLAGGARESLFDRVRAVDPGDAAFIQYTSGTTGQPKGVMLSHKNIVSQRRSQDKIWTIAPGSRFLSYLPWHHSYGGLFERFAALFHGAALYLEDSLGKDTGRLIDNWRLVRPTHFFSVPRVYRALVSEARSDPRTRDTLFHPDLHFVFTAAAPLPADVDDYFSGLNVEVLEGWGLTETSPTVTMTRLGSKRYHSFVGQPIPGSEVLVADDGEIRVRGPNLMTGYFQDPERTAGAIDSDGWLKTGDIGELGPEGLKLKSRRDGLFKLSNGEMVSCSEVENALTASSTWTGQAVAVGAGQNFVAALLFPNFRRLEDWARQNNRHLPQGWEIGRDKDIRELFYREVEQFCRDLYPPYLRVKAFVVVPHELSVEGGSLTPSLKVVRFQVMQEYQEWIKAIFDPGLYPERLPDIAFLKPH